MSSFVKFFQQPRNYWLRWVLLLPIVVVTYVLISPLVKIIFELPMFLIEFGPWYKRFVVAAVAGFATGNGSIGIVPLIAPKAKKASALVFLIILCISIGAVMFTGYTNSEYSPITENIACLFGALACYSNIDKDGNTIVD
ncbi:hypothetical protein VRU48_03965 [Pedobacter sp. KR3-3]|uniref:Uncharacterized protein n=1 Tax=Pedobacter albus TaxID=3113905 RepID=A0ABU7I476_9SPHI|nr:hypothetical protein [Pedobacter sp. KR3-3]MEE1944250.1 hypothetical protein [Pedobacter sp. KR3-3]